MKEININFNEELSNKEIATIVLIKICGKVLANKDSYPPDIFDIAYRYLFTGCKSRSEYEQLVDSLIDNPYTREELLK